MKCLLFALSVILLDVMGCGSRHCDPYLNVNPNMIMFGQECSSSEITVLSNSRWTIAATSDWLKISPTSGKGDAKILVSTLSSNESTYERSCILTISCEDIQQQVRVHQIGKVYDDGM